MTDIPCLIINLETDTQRLASATEQVEKLGLPYRVSPAVDGRRLTDPEGFHDIRSEFPEYLPATLAELDILPTEAGCFLSFIRAFRYCVSQGYDNVLIVEDDIEFRFDDRNILDQLVQIDLNWDLLKLAYTEYPLARGIPLGRREIGQQWLEFYMYWRGMSGALCNLYSASAMRKILHHLPQFGLSKPIDSQLVLRRHKLDFQIIFVRPALAGENVKHPSTIIQGRHNVDHDQHFRHRQKFWQKKKRQLLHIGRDLRRPFHSLLKWLSSFGYVYFVCKYLFWNRTRSDPTNTK